MGACQTALRRPEDNFSQVSEGDQASAEHSDKSSLGCNVNYCSLSLVRGDTDDRDDSCGVKFYSGE